MAGGAVLGFFAGEALAGVVAEYLLSNPAIMARIPSWILTLVGVGKAAEKAIGKTFQIGQGIGTIQIGVDPRTLISMKDLSTLDPKRMADAIKYAGSQAIEVTTYGEVLNGHHRLAYAIMNGQAVDVVIKIFSKLAGGNLYGTKQQINY